MNRLHSYRWLHLKGIPSFCLLAFRVQHLLDFYRIYSWKIHYRCRSRLKLTFEALTWIVCSMGLKLLIYHQFFLLSFLVCAFKLLFFLLGVLEHSFIIISCDWVCSTDLKLAVRSVWWPSSELACCFSIGIFSGIILVMTWIDSGTLKTSSWTFIPVSNAQLNGWSS